MSFTPIKAASSMPVAVIDAERDHGCGASDRPVQGRNAAPTLDGIIFRYEWLFGDGTTSHDRNDEAHLPPLLEPALSRWSRAGQRRRRRDRHEAIQVASGTPLS